MRVRARCCSSQSNPPPLDLRRPTPYGECLIGRKDEAGRGDKLCFSAVFGRGQSVPLNRGDYYCSSNLKAAAKVFQLAKF